MAYMPRYFRPDEIYFITSRTIDGALFLRPSKEVNNAIGAVLADAQQRTEVELLDFVFLSNHMHLVVRSRKGRIPEFMQYLKANIASEVNRILGRRGHLWERRYMASPILDEGAQIERAIYLYGHGPKEGLVARSAEWPGIASVKLRLSSSRQPPSYVRFDHTGFSRAAFRHGTANADDFKRTVTVKLSPWPFLEGLSDAERLQRVCELVDTAEEQAGARRRGKPVLGVERVLAQDPWDRPLRPTIRTPRPLCHAHSVRLRREYREAYALFLTDYRDASERFRRGELFAPFPRYAFRPPVPLNWSRRAGPGPVAVITAP